MKKICFILAFMLLVSSSQCFAMKIIVNNENSRIVPSRSTSHYESDLDAAYHSGNLILENQTTTSEAFTSAEQNEEELQQNEASEEIAEEVPVNYVRREITDEEINNLSSDFRDELIGTYWNYAELEPLEPLDAQESTAEEVADENVANDEDPQAKVVAKEVVEKNNEMDIYSIKKLGSREAADYYMIDSIKDPNNAVPSGYPQ